MKGLNILMSYLFFHPRDRAMKSGLSILTWTDWESEDGRIARTAKRTRLVSLGDETNWTSNTSPLLSFSQFMLEQRLLCFVWFIPLQTNITHSPIVGALSSLLNHHAGSSGFVFSCDVHFIHYYWVCGKGKGKFNVRTTYQWRSVWFRRRLAIDIRHALVGSAELVIYNQPEASLSDIAAAMPLNFDLASSVGEDQSPSLFQEPYNSNDGHLFSSGGTSAFAPPFELANADCSARSDWMLPAIGKSRVRREETSCQNPAFPQRDKVLETLLNSEELQLFSGMRSSKNQNTQRIKTRVVLSRPRASCPGESAPLGGRAMRPPSTWVSTRGAKHGVLSTSWGCRVSQLVCSSIRAPFYKKLKSSGNANFYATGIFFQKYPI